MSFFEFIQKRFKHIPVSFVVCIDSYRDLVPVYLRSFSSACTELHLHEQGANREYQNTEKSEQYGKEHTSGARVNIKSFKKIHLKYLLLKMLISTDDLSDFVYKDTLCLTL